MNPIAQANDLLRTTLLTGNVILTPGFRALDQWLQTRLMAEVRSFKNFTEDNDPYGEHDFGSIEAEGTAVFWKIDYYDPTLRYQSDDPADPAKTRRILTIMLAEEY